MAEQVAFNRDCMEAMKEFPDKFFDLAVVDPPYGIGEGGQKSLSRCKQVAIGRKQNNSAAYARYYHTFDDSKSPPKEYFDELRRISKDQIIFGANHFISKIPIDSHCWIVWDKVNGESDFADCELAWTSFKSAVRIFRFKWNGMLQENMKNKEVKIHPTQKPVQLYQWIYKKYAQQGMKILDTHLGSGSSRIAAYDAGLDFWGYEIDKFYFEKQEERFEKHTSQLNLFVEPEQTDLFS